MRKVMLRSFVALVLAVAVGSGPMAMDLCAHACQAPHLTGRTASDPVCHRSTATTTHLETIPVGCGHDHGGTGTIVAGGSDVAPRTPFVAVLQALGPASVQSALSHPFIRLPASPPPDLLGQGSISSLRI